MSFNFNTSSLQTALNPTITSSQISPAVINNSNTNATSLNPAENIITGSSTNTPSTYVNGTAATADTGLKRSNQNLSHACDHSSYVGMAVSGLGAIAGAAVRAIREAITAILEALGISPSGSAITNKLKKLAQYIKDVATFIKSITTALQQVIAYMNVLKQLISSILSLPSILLSYFKDCITNLNKQLIAAYNGALNDSDETPSEEDQQSLSDAISGVKSSINQFTQSVSTLASTSSALTTSLTSTSTVSSGNTQAQQAATAQVYASLGYSSTTNNFSKA
jgi:uncharacterized protein YoxC